MIYLGEGFAEGCGGRERLRALARKEKKFAFCMNWEIKRNWRSGSTVNPSLIPLWRGQPHSPSVNHCVLHFRSQGHREPGNKVGSINLAERLVGFELGTFRF